MVVLFAHGSFLMHNNSDDFSRLRWPHVLLLAGLLAYLLLVGCDQAGAPKPVPDSVRPAFIIAVEPLSAVTSLRLPGRVRSMRRAELSFDVPGFVDSFSLEEGRQVERGEVVARLDSRVYRARLAAARAEFERARTDLDRYQRLWDTEQAVARSEVDERRARLESARTSLAVAEQDLADTEIKAPFTGVITRRRIEPFSNVQAKQAIAELQDLRKLEVVVNVPERLVRRLQPQQAALAYLEGDAQQPLELTLKSFGAEADPLTQSYPVVLTVISRPLTLNILPGMAVTVQPSAAVESLAADSQVAIPLTAVATDAQGKQVAWVVDELGLLAYRPIRTGTVKGALIVVEEGLAPGERIVGAGLGALREGMRVRPLDEH